MEGKKELIIDVARKGKSKKKNTKSKVRAKPDGNASRSLKIANSLSNSVASKVEKLGLSTINNMMSKKPLAYAKNEFQKEAMKGIGIKNASERVAAAITCPMLCPPVRYSDRYTGAPTTVSAPWTVKTPIFNGTATVRDIPTTDYVAFMFRNAECALIQYDPNIAAAAFSYLIQVALPSATGDTGTVGLSNAFTVALLAGVPTHLTTPYAIANVAYQPHDSTWFAMIDGANNKEKFFYLSTNDYYFVANNAYGAGALSATLDYIGSEGERTTAIVSVVLPIGGGATNLVAPKNGYYHIYFTATANANLAVTSFGLVGGGGGVWGHQQLPNYAAHTSVFSSGLRIIGASLMYSNTTPFINRGGDIVGAQVGPELRWNKINSFKAASTLEGASVRVMDNGLYGFLRPSKQEDFNRQEYLVLTNGVIIDCNRPIRLPTDYMVFYSNVSTQANAAVQAAYLTICMLIEGVPVDSWEEVAKPDLTELEFSGGLEIVKNVAQFHDNPTHWGEIWSTIKSTAKDVMGFVQDVGLPIINVAKAISSVL